MSLKDEAQLSVDLSKWKCTPGLFRNPLSGSHLFQQTSGSRGARTTICVDLAKMKGDAAHRKLALQLRNDSHKQVAIWMMPASSDLKLLLIFCCMVSTNSMVCERCGSSTSISSMASENSIFAFRMHIWGITFTQTCICSTPRSPSRRPLDGRDAQNWRHSLFKYLCKFCCGVV
jgi:hypothetical protein